MNKEQWRSAFIVLVVLVVCLLVLHNLTYSQSYDNVLVSVGEQSVEKVTDNQGNTMFVVNYYDYNETKAVKALVNSCVKARVSTTICNAYGCETIVYNEPSHLYLFLGYETPRIAEIRKKVTEWALTNKITP